MYNNEIFDAEEDITENDIAEIENKYNYKMPEMIKKHFLKYNGGYPEKSAYTKGGDILYVIEYFIPIKNDNGGRSLDKVLKLLKDDNIMPKWLIPFADEEGGNLFCYSLRQKELGAIYYYNHEFEYGENPENHICYISKSLQDFMNSLVEYEEE